MWVTIQFSLFIIIFCLALTLNSRSLAQFALYSELVWVGLYLLTSLLGSFVDSIELLSTPFIILVLTAVEASII